MDIHCDYGRWTKVKRHHCRTFVGLLLCILKERLFRLPYATPQIIDITFCFASVDKYFPWINILTNSISGM